MIAYLNGKIIYKSINYFLIEVNNVGYKVFASENFLNEVSLDKQQESYISHQVREDSSDLYGFKSINDLELFEMLLSVSGVGPKSALGVLNIASADDVKESILRGDANLLTKVAGIGKKTAERLVLELKNKVLKLEGTSKESVGNISHGADEIDALVSLGYSVIEARDALNKVDKDIIDSGKRVKEALKNIKN
ncbi:MAG: Holliday junction branch migration protein RuvA [Patescibacteria group bacterium]|jgi:Holliday junction DNA helicase RuvA|nr:Holliday junction branch migration protein RuvA [Patescibacteria group bacterium]